MASLQDFVDAASATLQLSHPPHVVQSLDAGVGAAAEWNRRQPIIQLTQGFLRITPADEQKAVVAHELAHIAYGDMRLAALARAASRLAAAVALLGLAFVPMILLLTNAGEGMAISAAIGPVAAVIALGLSGLLDRRREFAADRFAASLVGVDAVAAALRRREALEADARRFGGWRVGIAGFSLARPSAEVRMSALADGDVP